MVPRVLMKILLSRFIVTLVLCEMVVRTTFVTSFTTTRAISPLCKTKLSKKYSFSYGLGILGLS